MDRRLAKPILGILDKQLVKIEVIDVVQSNKCSENIRREVLQDVELVMCQ